MMCSKGREETQVTSCLSVPCIFIFNCFSGGGSFSQYSCSVPFPSSSCYKSSQYPFHLSTICRSTVDIQCLSAENRQEKNRRKKKKEERQKYNGLSYSTGRPQSTHAQHQQAHHPDWHLPDTKRTAHLRQNWLLKSRLLQKWRSLNSGNNSFVMCINLNNTPYTTIPSKFWTIKYMFKIYLKCVSESRMIN